MSEINLHQLYEDFQKAFPIEKLSEMTLEQYTNLNRSDSFTYWVEIKTRALGSIKGGNSYKFGIYEYENTPKGNPPLYKKDEKYSWEGRLGDERDKVFEIIKSRIIKIAKAAREGDFLTIENEKGLWDSYKWKIAFLYSNETIVPIYNKKWLINISRALGGEFNFKSPIADIQTFLLSKRNGKDIHDFGRELWAIRNNNTQQKDNHKIWLYAPGDGASEWQRCLVTSTMCLGWDKIGDFSQYKSREEIISKLKEVENKESNFPNDSLAIWDFLNTIQPGDEVIAKKGLYKILGKGIVEGEYYYDETLTAYNNIRKVKWSKDGEWEAPQQLPQKTLTDITSYSDLVSQIEELFENNDSQNTSQNYWWLVANPKYFRFSDIEVGKTVDYTVKTDKGNPRRHAVNFENANKGDIVIGYEANPVKKIVSLLIVERESDGETILFKKTEDLMFPVSWFEFKDIPELQEMEFLINRNGSFFKLTHDEYEILLNLIRQDNPEPEDNPIAEKKKTKKYTEIDFLNEVYLSKDELNELINLLRHKQNIILQGAPGVGKTFTAKRLAYMMMGEIDKSRVDMVQFHQNFSYEDFIMGYKPTADGGFELIDGKFMEFCRKAKDNPQNDYFFIIDEINRGNLSKIFGELLMLIEKGYRGESIELAYNKQPFAVPKNIYLIGMMNTADRSLAMIDYALRRRFAFFPMSPGFDKESFRNEISKSTDERVSKVIEAVKKLNEEISKDDSLGDGFCIGHSYFCDPKPNKDWIDNIVKYEICPMLEEYWFDNKSKAEEEKRKLLDILK